MRRILCIKKIKTTINDLYSNYRQVLIAKYKNLQIEKALKVKFFLITDTKIV